MSVRSYISETTGPNFTYFWMLLVAVARSSFDGANTLFTSGFVDYVMFSHNGLYGQS